MRHQSTTRLGVSERRIVSTTAATVTTMVTALMTRMVAVVSRKRPGTTKSA